MTNNQCEQLIEAIRYSCFNVDDLNKIAAAVENMLDECKTRIEDLQHWQVVNNQPICGIIY